LDQPLCYCGATAGGTLLRVPVIPFLFHALTADNFHRQTIMGSAVVVRSDHTDAAIQLQDREADIRQPRQSLLWSASSNASSPSELPEPLPLSLIT
jgi:hypothetical protein